MDINSSQKHQFDQARNSLDLNGLNKIREQSRESGGEAKEAALKEAAQQFEAIFMKMLLASMRKAQEVLESDSPFNSQSNKFYRDMHDQQMAVELSSNGSLGLTDLIVRQLGGDNGNYKPSSILRNDGNLPVSINVNLAPNAGSLSNIKPNNDKPSSDNVNSEEDKERSQSVNKINSLVEKMLSNNTANNTGVEIPLTANIPNNVNVALADTVNQLIQKQKTKDAAKPQNVNNSAPISTQDFNEPKDFVMALIEPAKKVQEKLGIPFEVVIAQAALETGWGQKIIKKSDGDSSNNLFNIKADSRWAGDKTTKETLEFEQGAMIKKSEPFRNYESLNDSIDDYINFLSTNDRYGEALQKTSNVEHFLQGLQKAGYATDPQYANKILGTLKSVSNLLVK